MLNYIVIQGRLAKDPELRYTKNQPAVATFSVAVQRDYDRDKADFIDVTVWRQTAEFVSNYFRKGQMIALDGSIQTRTYTDSQGNKRKSTEIVANNVSFTESKRDSAGGSYQNPGASPYAAARPEPAAEPAPAYTSGSTGDFEEIPMDDDLPF